MKKNTLMAILLGMTISCSTNKEQKKETDFKYFLEQFADIKILQYQIPGWDKLSLQKKKLCYYLSQAALCGRDIIFEQNFKYNLPIRHTLAAIVKSYSGDKSDKQYKKLLEYTKRVWLANGIHHHYGKDKFVPEFSADFFARAIELSDAKLLPLREGETVKELTQFLSPILFNEKLYAKNLSLKKGEDIVQTSAGNYYDNVTQAEVEAFYAKQKEAWKDKKHPISFGLNSRLVKREGKIYEEVYKVGGKYSKAIEQIVHWLGKAQEVAETEHQAHTIAALIKYYHSGNLQDFDHYNILWVKDVHPQVDFINGFIEVYGDPLGMKASWESVVNIKDMEATERMELIARNAQWFEDNAPIKKEFKKKKVKGIIAKVIEAVHLGGDCYPTTPIGINLPNADWIRKEHGSKSVTIANITNAYNEASKGSGFLQEFAASEKEIDLEEKYGHLTSNLHTDLHECLGHASGQILPGTDPDALKNYSNTLEEARADLFALYYIADKKLLELNLVPNEEAYKAEYDGYIRNGLLTQLVRIKIGDHIEEAHMRNRQLISKWVYEKGKAQNVIQRFKKENKTYIKINDYAALRNLFGELLAEVQRIKSEGDFEAGQQLVEAYGVEVDLNLHKEIKARFDKLNIAPYGGFLNPIMMPVEKNGEIVDVKLSWQDDYLTQMQYYDENYSFLSPEIKEHLE